MRTLLNRAFGSLSRAAMFLSLMALAVVGTAFLSARIAEAALGDLWEARDETATHWRVDGNGHFKPGRATYINSTNTTLTAANAPLIYLVNMSGNHTLTLPAVNGTSGVGRHARYRIIDCGNVIGTTGNLTINVTSSGNVNNIDSITVTNTSGATGAVAWIEAWADGNVTQSNEYYVGVTRR